MRIADHKPEGDLPMAMRMIEPDDRSYVLSSWKHCVAEQPQYLGIKKPVLFDRLNGCLEGILDASVCVLAVNPEDQKHVLGFIVYDAPRIHWVTTRHTFRHLGVARALLHVATWAHTNVRIPCTFWSDKCEDWLGFYYSPRYLRGAIEDRHAKTAG